MEKYNLCHTDRDVIVIFMYEKKNLEVVAKKTIKNHFLKFALKGGDPAFENLSDRTGVHLLEKQNRFVKNWFKNIVPK